MEYILAANALDWDHC